MEDKLKDLKAKAYDLIVTKEQTQAELNKVNQEIVEILEKNK